MTKKKDCIIRVLSKGLNIDYESIPKFYEKEDTWNEDYDKWLTDNNMLRVVVDSEYTDPIKIPHFSTEPILIIGILNKYNDDHAVILTNENNNLTMEDLNNDGRHGLEDLVQIEMIFNHRTLCPACGGTGIQVMHLRGEGEYTHPCPECKGKKYTDK